VIFARRSENGADGANGINAENQRNGDETEKTDAIWPEGPALRQAALPMLKVALTGGIATGKSYVLDRFRERAVPCFDADELAHEATSAGTDTTAAIAARFGDDILGPDGSVNRVKLAPIVFADPDARRELEAIVHPAVYRALRAAIRALESSGDAALTIVDIPLLFETGAEKQFDRVIVTSCPPAVQIARLLERGLSETAGRQRIAAQWPIDEKASRADFVIRTDGTFAETDRQVDQVLKALQP
jgi:dephospho-CoA kinase